MQTFSHPKFNHEIYGMSNTYTKIFLHIIFALKVRESLLPPTIRTRVHAYIAETLRRLGHHPIKVGGVQNHVHILVDYSPSQSIPEMVRDTKASTTKFINSQRFIPFLFAWQRGYACFSHSPSQIPDVKSYVEHQNEHHNNMSLRDEIVKLYTRYGIEYNEEYIFEDHTN